MVSPSFHQRRMLVVVFVATIPAGVASSSATAINGSGISGTEKVALKFKRGQVNIQHAMEIFNPVLRHPGSHSKFE